MLSRVLRISVFTVLFTVTAGLFGLATGFGQAESEPLTAEEAIAELDCAVTDKVHVAYPSYVDASKSEDAADTALKKFLAAAFPDLSADDFSAVAVGGGEAQFTLGRDMVMRAAASELPMVASAYLTETPLGGYIVESFAGCDTELSDEGAGK